MRKEEEEGIFLKLTWRKEARDNKRSNKTLAWHGEISL